MEWQPIETAQVDGNWVLVWYPDGMDCSIAYINDEGTWQDWDGDLYGPPTHWMPLPNPPSPICS